MNTMKSIIFIIIVVCITLQFSCDSISDTESTNVPYLPLEAFDVQWNKQNSLVCFGTSLTYGYGAGAKKFDPSGPIGIPGGTTPVVINIGDSSYPRFLQEKLKIKVINQGYVGARLNYALTLLNDSIISKKPALVLLEFGANDFLWNISAHISDSLLSLMITQLHNKGVKVVLLSFIDPDMLHYSQTGNWSSEDSILALQYQSMIKNISARFAVPMIEYPLKGIFGHPELMSDALHPNGIGYKRMEENIYYALIKTFEKNGMLK